MENKRKITKRNLKKSLIAGVTTLALITSLTPNLNVDAKKKNHKPTLAFGGTLRKKKKLTIKEGKKVYVKGIAKDREDGNISKKIKMKITKPKGGKYKRSGRYIKFINSGRYKITLSVKDSNKATKSLSRTILVKETPDVVESAIFVPSTTYSPNPTSTPSSTKKPSSSPTASSTKSPSVTSTPKTSPSPSPKISPSPSPTVFNPDVIKYGATKKTFGDNTYNVTTKKITNSNFMNDATIDKPSIYIENDYGRIYYDIDSNYTSTDEYLRFLGKVSAKDYKGNDISSNLIISTNGKFDSNGNVKNDLSIDYSIYIYVEDKNGNAYTKQFFIRNLKYTAIQKIDIMNAPENYFGVLETSPYIVQAQRRELFTNLKGARKTLTLED